MPRNRLNINLKVHQVRSIIEMLLSREDERKEKEMTELIKIIRAFDLGYLNLKSDLQLDDKDAVELCKKTQYLFLRRGKPLFREKEENDRMYFLMYGSMIASAPETMVGKSPLEPRGSTFMTQTGMKTKKGQFISV